MAGEKVFRLKLWPDELKQATLPPETFPPIRYIYICCHFTDTTTCTLTRDTQNRFDIFESSKRELFESVNCVLNVKKI